MMPTKREEMGSTVVENECSWTVNECERRLENRTGRTERPGRTLERETGD
jgi:hypothetical protein